MAKFTVKATETGAISGDGGGSRSYTTTPKTPGHNVTTNAARHATGQSLANVGAQRGGQAEPASNKVKTGVPASAPIRSMAPRPSIPANQAETSKDLEARIRAKPQPFTYDTTTPNMPTGRHDGSTEGIRYNVMAPVNAKPQSYGSPVMSKQQMSDAVGGGMPTTGYNAINNGFQGGGASRQAGRPGSRNSNTSSQDNSRMRQGS